MKTGIRLGYVVASCSLMAPIMALRAADTVPLPRTVTSLSLDAGVVATKDATAEKQWLATNGAGEKDAARLLDTQIAKNDVRAAAAKANAARAGKGKASDLADAATLERVFDQGVAAGLPEAFQAKGELALDRGNTADAVRYLRDASNRGSSSADRKLAAIKAKDPAAAITESPVTLLSRAADKGDATAALQLGLALDRGSWQVDETQSVAVPKAPTEAVAWMERAAALGSAEAGLWLGLHYMRQAEGIVDIRRHWAREYFQTAKLSAPGAKDPVSGKTYAELEQGGAIEPGLAAEIRRRDAKIAVDKAQVAAVKAPTGKDATEAAARGAAAKRRIDHQAMEIVGDAGGAVYNVVGLSPYKEIAGEGTVASAASKSVVLDKNPARADGAGWRIDLVVDGSSVFSTAVASLDRASATVGLTDALPARLPGGLRYRLVRYHTFHSTFGQHNFAGLRPGTSAAGADEAIVKDSRTQAWRRLFFHVTRLAWVDSATGAGLENDFELAPGYAVCVKRSEAGTLMMQVRGMLPEQAFDFTPEAGTQLISTRKNQAAADIGTGLAMTAPAKVSDLVLATKRGKAWAADRKGATAWWSVLGLQATDRIYLVGNSAAVVASN